MKFILSCDAAIVATTLKIIDTLAVVHLVEAILKHMKVYFTMERLSSMASHYNIISRKPCTKTIEPTKTRSRYYSSIGIMMYSVYMFLVFLALTMGDLITSNVIFVLLILELLGSCLIAFVANLFTLLRPTYSIEIFPEGIAVKNLSTKSVVHVFSNTDRNTPKHTIVAKPRADFLCYRNASLSANLFVDNIPIGEYDNYESVIFDLSKSITIEDNV